MHLDVSRQYVRIATDLYVSNDIYGADGSRVETHTQMATIEMVRAWRAVPEIAQQGILHSRFLLGAASSPDWSQFDHLKTFTLEYISSFYGGQRATMIAQNRMVLELVRLVHELIVTGFYRSSELSEIVMPMMQLLDGRGMHVCMYVCM